MVGAVSVLHPWLAAGGLAAGLIPVIIHLINRRRHRRVEWAAMSFLLRATQRRARHIRLEQWLLFAVRVLVVVLIGTALARPYVTGSALSSLGRSHAHRIILLDNSGSMGTVVRAEYGGGEVRGTFPAASVPAGRGGGGLDATTVLPLTQPLPPGERGGGGLDSATASPLSQPRPPGERGLGVGSTVYDRAQEAAANLLGSFSKSDRVSVVTLAD
ncbi:MAG: hypothetical protein GY842_09975, partial [bacterium]|nr:hypothetical protein [bacterium]